MRTWQAELSKDGLKRLNETFDGTYKFTRRNIEHLDAMYLDFYGRNFSYCAIHNVCAVCGTKMKVVHYTYVCKKCFLEMLARIANEERRERFMAQYAEYLK